MARVRMVTRTIVATKVNVLCLNVETCEPFNKEVTISGTFDKPEKLEKAVKKIVDNETEKAVQIVHSEPVETLYGMTEQDFIAHAEILPPRSGETVEE